MSKKTSLLVILLLVSAVVGMATMWGWLCHDGTPVRQCADNSDGRVLDLSQIPSGTLVYRLRAIDQILSIPRRTSQLPFLHRADRTSASGASAGPGCASAWAASQPIEPPFDACQRKMNMDWQRILSYILGTAQERPEMLDR